MHKFHCFFFFVVEAIIYLLLHNLHGCTFKSLGNTQNQIPNREHHERQLQLYAKHVKNIQAPAGQ